MGVEVKEGKHVHQLWVQKIFDASDAEHMSCMFYTMYQKTGPNRNVAIKKMHIDGDKYYPFLYHECPEADLSLMKCIVNKLPSVAISFSFMIKSPNFVDCCKLSSTRNILRS